MSGTLASLIRQHQLNPKTLYLVPETGRESAPGRYDQTGSQKSPALDRRVEKEAAKTTGEGMGLDPDELDDVDGFDKLQDVLDDKLTDPTGGDPTENPTEPLNPFLPDPDDPNEDPPDAIPPDAIPGLRVYALHSSSISYSNNGGATFREYDAPVGAIGFAVTREGVYVATHDGIYCSTNLQNWTELEVAGDGVPISGFQNGGFESGLSGWDLVTGIEPWTGTVEDIEPTEGSSYLGRDWIVFSNGQFVIQQEVALSPSEVIALEKGAALRLSADAWADGGAQAQISVSGVPARPEVNDFSFSGPASGGVGAQFVADGFATIAGRSLNLRGEVLSASSGSTIGPSPYGGFLVQSTGGTSAVEIAFQTIYADNGMPYYGPLSIMLTDIDKVGSIAESISIPAVTSYHLPAGSTVAVSGTTFTGTQLNDPGDVGGSVLIHIDSAASFNASFTGGAQSGLIWYAPSSDDPRPDDYVPLIVASRSAPGWERIIAEGAVGAYEHLRVLVAGEGSPADVYVDNMKLELMLPAGGSAEVTAIGKGSGGVQAAINGNLYKLLPGGMRFSRALSFDAEEIDDGVVFGGNKIIFGVGEPVTAPGSIAQYLGDRTILTTGGSIHQHEDGDDVWHELSEVAAGSRVFRAFNGYLAFGDDGSAQGARSLSGPWESVPRFTGTYVGTRGLITIGGRLFGWIEGRSILWWLNGNVWRAAGSASAEILDISGR